MSKRFLAKLAGGVALGSAALLLSAPTAALAASDDDYKYRVSDRDGVVCGNNDQFNKVIVANIISGNDIEDSDVEFNQRAEADADNDSRQARVICFRDVDVEVDVDRRGRGPLQPLEGLRGE
ncbi:hypothetical protein [Micromonospora psammae]|uniref:hypothetical protein n=1 Tax=Micromonospora sp. CPCC 205556 TaxID=3122398 RepID=UPI002FEF4629